VAAAVVAVIAVIAMVKAGGGGPAAPPSAPPTVLAASVAVRTGTPDVEALRRNLSEQAARPGPLRDALRTALGPGTSDERIADLERELTLLLAGGRSPAQAMEHLQADGMDGATAQRVVDAACTVERCPGR